MKTLVYSLIGLVVFVLTMLIIFSLISRQTPKLGVLGDTLRPCPETPNCVCSEFKGKISTVAPLSFQGDPNQSWEKAKQVTTDLGGVLLESSDKYARFTFTTPWLRFIDDLELRLDSGAKLIHIRSASRVGHSDLGVNYDRVNKIRQQFEAK